jgi:hypothetical protein
MGIVIPMSLKRFFGRRAKTFDQASAEDVTVRDYVSSDCHVLVVHQRREGGIDIAELNPAGTEITAIEITGKVTVPP